MKNDANGDGISGNNYVYDQVLNQIVLGRFGWKESQPSLVQQAAAAAMETWASLALFSDETSKGQAQM